MKYIDIENALIKQKPIFSKKDTELAGFKVFPYLLLQWVKRGYIKRLAGGWYYFSKAEVSSEAIANHLHQPSYISLEYALYYYNLTVDISFHITSVTSKGTRVISADGYNYFYHHVKPEVFTGFVIKQIGDRDEIGKKFYIATPEKALVDLFYLNPNKYKSVDDFKEARFHEEEMKTLIDWRGVFSLALLYQNKALEKRLNNFKNYIFSF